MMPNLYNPSKNRRIYYPKDERDREKKNTPEAQHIPKQRNSPIT